MAALLKTASWGSSPYIARGLPETIHMRSLWVRLSPKVTVSLKSIWKAYVGEAQSKSAHVAMIVRDMRV